MISPVAVAARHDDDVQSWRLCPPGRMADSVILLMTPGTRTSRPCHRKRGARGRAERPPVPRDAGHEYPMANQGDLRPLEPVRSWLQCSARVLVAGHVEERGRLSACQSRGAFIARPLEGPQDPHPRPSICAQGGALQRGVGHSRPWDRGSGEAESRHRGVGIVRPRGPGSGEMEWDVLCLYWVGGNRNYRRWAWAFMTVALRGIRRSLIFPLTVSIVNSCLESERASTVAEMSACLRLSKHCWCCGVQINCVFFVEEVSGGPTDETIMLDEFSVISCQS
uniref:Uncharacterized protein n=1 Tax=Setaria viridis TaxID=4556 RepID=A0A4U6SWX2_SETVI|nr:hypothetical protein SEVIR_9G123900v2 [Setaria viridis]